MLPASTGERKQRDVSQGPPRRPHRRDPAPDRPLAARRRRLRRRSASARSRSTATCCRPTAARAAPSITGGYVALELALRAARRRGQARARCRSPAVGRRGLVRDRRRRAAARPRLLRGLDRRGRRERRHDRRRRARRGAGDRRAHAALARASLDELLALAADGIDRAARRPGAGGRGGAAGRVSGAAACSPRATSTSCASSRGCCAGHELDAAARRASSCRPRPARRSPTTRSARRAPPRPRPGAPRSPTTRASRRPRSAARPGSARRATPARTPPTRRTSRSCCARSPAGDRRVAYVCALAYVDPGGAERVVRGALRRARSPREPRGERRLRLRPRVRARRRRRRTARWPS